MRSAPHLHGLVLAAAIIFALGGVSPLMAAQLMNVHTKNAAPATAAPEQPAENAENTENNAPTPDADSGNAAARAVAGEGGAGDLLIAPTRIVLDDKKRSGEVSLNNRGDKEATYRISMVRMRMLDSGAYEEVKDAKAAKAGEAYADDVVRFSPHQVTLKPGQSQSVKFAVNNLGNLAPGEYRIHAMFRGNPQESQGMDLEQTTADNKQITVRLVPIYGITIPVIVRHGELAATAGISSARISGKKLTVTLTRQGNKSLFGDVIITAKTGSGEVTVGQVRGIAVFVPNTRRVVQVDLVPPEGTELSGAALSATYREREEDGSKILAQASVGGKS